MASENANIFKTPKKVLPNRVMVSPSRRLPHRSPLTNIQNIPSMASNCNHYTTDSPVRIVPHAHHTPPRSFFNKIRNPFERALVESLNTPICSPGMFKIRETSGNFTWDIEQVCILQPKHIVPCNSQFEHTPDPILEKRANEAIDKYFSQSSIVPSPLDVAPKRITLLRTDNDLPLHTPERPAKSINREVWTQTVLSLPPELPSSIDDVLKPFYTYTMDQNRSSDADNSANASLRRKLCFEEASDDEAHNPCSDFFRARSVEHEPGNASSLEMEHYSYSPVIAGKTSVQYQVKRSEFYTMKSPSVSPISQHKSPQDFPAPKSTPNTSPDKHDSLPYSYNYSPLSQSTPERSGASSKLSTTSTPDIINSLDSERKIYDVTQSKHTKEAVLLSEQVYISRMGKRSRSDTSVASLGTQTVHCDLHMDITSDTSINSVGDQSLSGTSHASNTEDCASKSVWKMDVDHHSGISSEDNLDNYKNTVDSSPEHSCDYKSAILDNEDEGLSEIYQFLTPTKMKTKDRPFREPLQIFNHSPTHMSLDSSYEIDKHNAPELFSKSSYTTQSILDTTKTKQQILSGNLANCFTDCENITMCNDSSRHFCKSLSNTELSGVSWKRCDSGFNEDCSQQSVSIECFKQTTKCNTILEYSEENKENSHYFGAPIKSTTLAPIQDVMSMSGVLSEDIVSFDCKFASTPSHSNRY